MTPEQCGAARELLGWTHLDLARAAGCTSQKVRYVEMGRGHPRPHTIAKIRTALEAAGVEFIAENGRGPGVRLRKADT